jgi:hypothetical protein
MNEMSLVNSLGRLAAHPVDLDVLEPEVEAAENGAGIKSPLGDQVPGLLRSRSHGILLGMSRIWVSNALGYCGGPEPIVGKVAIKIKARLVLLFFLRQGKI